MFRVAPVFVVKVPNWGTSARGGLASAMMLFKYWAVFGRGADPCATAGDGMIELTLSPKGWKAEAVADSFCSTFAFVASETKGSLWPAFSGVPADLTLEDLRALGSSGEKAVNFVSGVPPADSSHPLDECGDAWYMIAVSPMELSQGERLEESALRLLVSWMLADRTLWESWDVGLTVVTRRKWDAYRRKQTETVLQRSNECSLVLQKGAEIHWDNDWQVFAVMLWCEETKEGGCVGEKGDAGLPGLLVRSGGSARRESEEGRCIHWERPIHLQGRKALQWIWCPGAALKRNWCYCRIAALT